MLAEASWGWFRTEPLLTLSATGRELTSRRFVFLALRANCMLVTPRVMPGLDHGGALHIHTEL